MTLHPNTPKQNLFRAACLFIAGLWVLSVLDGTGKWLQQVGVGLPVVLWFRYAGQAIWVSIICLIKRKTLRWQVRSVKLQLLRGVLMLVSSITFFSSLKFLPLAEATAVNFVAPVFTLVLAPWLLKETGLADRLPLRWPLVFASLVGAFLVVRPGAGFSFWGTILAVTTALAFSLYQLATRKAAGDDALISNLYTGWTGTVLVSLFLLIPHSLTGSGGLTEPRPTLHWLALALLGAVATLGHTFQVNAFRRAPANALTPFTYLQVVSALTVGWLYFNQWPDHVSMLGMAIICVSGLVGLYRAKTIAH
jgi:drug/metabolite transporter (DMT)-like permease